MNRPMSLLSLALLALGCAHARQVASNDLRPSDLAVYRAVLDSMFVPQTAGRVTQLVVKDSTTVWKRENLVSGVIEGFYRLAGVDTAAVRDFEGRNRDAHSLKELSQAGLPIPIALVNNQTLRALPREDADRYWSQFYELYPGSNGHIGVSAIGYSAHGDVAILMVGIGCGSLCGGGYMVSLRRSGATWRIAVIQATWVS
jgi:hypothetical protein